MSTGVTALPPRGRSDGMVQLSVNVNKIATLRNSRGGSEPDMLRAVQTCLRAGAKGITVHPRQDQRHIRVADVDAIAEFLKPYKDEVEYNIEGDPRPDLIDLVLRVRPDQCTLVPVRPGEVTSEAGWPEDTPLDFMSETISHLKAEGIRVSVFVEPNKASIEWAASVGADRVELYTEPYARAFERGGEYFSQSLAEYGHSAEAAVELGLGVNAGHDLDLENLAPFAGLKGLDEVSIGHALMSEALFCGLEKVVAAYLKVLER